MNLYLKRLPRSIGSAKPLLYSGLSEQVNTRQETPNERVLGRAERGRVCVGRLSGRHLPAGRQGQQGSEALAILRG
jgi:hypothetical protein